MSMTAAIRPASAWTHAIVAVIADLGKSGQCTIEVSHDSQTGLLREFSQWWGIAATSQERPW